MRLDTKQEVIEYINNLENYQGYVQFSHREIEKSKDIFLDSNPKIEDEEGFVYEAHFYNEKEKKSISIKQINDKWFVSETDISNIDERDIQEYLTDIEKFNYKVKMAQIWKEENDPLCEDMKVKKLKKVVFAGFKGEKNDNSTI
jgi:CRISPR type III-associated protein (TIGR04423 family)